MPGPEGTRVAGQIFALVLHGSILLVDAVLLFVGGKGSLHILANNVERQVRVRIGVGKGKVEERPNHFFAPAGLWFILLVTYLRFLVYDENLL